VIFLLITIVATCSSSSVSSVAALSFLSPRFACTKNLFTDTTSLCQSRQPPSLAPSYEPYSYAARTKRGYRQPYSSVFTLTIPFTLYAVRTKPGYRQPYSTLITLTILFTLYECSEDKSRLSANLSSESAALGEQIKGTNDMSDGQVTCLWVY
jgi:hypothetical protein